MDDAGDDGMQQHPEKQASSHGPMSRGDGVPGARAKARASERAVNLMQRHELPVSILW